jgi:hypothetical protein
MPGGNEQRSLYRTASTGLEPLSDGAGPFVPLHEDEDGRRRRGQAGRHPQDPRQGKKPSLILAD